MKLTILFITLLTSNLAFAHNIAEENPVITRFKKEAKQLGYLDWQVNLGLSLYTKIQHNKTLDDFRKITHLPTTSSKLQKSNCELNYILYVNDDVNVYIPKTKEFTKISGVLFSRHNHQNLKPAKQLTGSYNCNNTETLVDITA